MTISSIPKIQNAGLRRLTLSAWEDLSGGLAKSELWGRLGWLDVKRRYRRTLLGPFWTSISLSVYVISVGIVGATLWHQNIREYLPFLASGMIAWFLVSIIITEACNLLVSGHALFRNVRFEYSILAYALVWRNFVVFLHNLIVYVVIVGVLKPELIGVRVLLAIPGVLLIAVNGVWIALLCGILCLRFRDVTQLVNSILPILLLITPIFWPPESMMGSNRLIFVETNPLYHMVEMVRGPLLGSVPGLTSYVVVLLITAGGWILTYQVFGYLRKRIAYWS